MLEVQNLSKSYKGKQALSSVSFTLENGVYGLLGPNGAGKSTLINLLTDNLTPDSGSVLWEGQPISKLGRRYRDILGFMPQQQGIYDEFTGRRFLTYIAALKEMPKKTAMQEIERTSRLVNLQDELDKRLGAYSGGMKQRILIAQAIMGTPKLLIFDEPTAGLDPYERVRTRNLFETLGKESIVLVATHVVSDVESAADKILLLQKGNLATFDTPNNLIEQVAPGGKLEDVYLHFFENEEGDHVPSSSL